MERRLQPVLICSCCLLKDMSVLLLSMAPWVACLTSFRLLSCSGTKEALLTEVRVLVMEMSERRCWVVRVCDSCQCPREVKYSVGLAVAV